MTTQVPAGTPAPEEVEVPKTLDERMDAVESVMLELIDRVEKLTQSTEAFKKTAVTKPKGLFGGKREPTPMKDMKTGTVYPSKAAVGKQFATEAGADPKDTMAYYTVLKTLKMPDSTDRFVVANAEEAAKARADYKAAIEVQVAETNKKLEAEAAAAAANPAAPAAGAAAAKPVTPAPAKANAPKPPKK